MLRTEPTLHRDGPKSRLTRDKVWSHITNQTSLSVNQTSLPVEKLQLVPNHWKTTFSIGPIKVNTIPIIQPMFILLLYVSLTQVIFYFFIFMPIPAQQLTTNLNWHAYLFTISSVFPYLCKCYLHIYVVFLKIVWTWSLHALLNRELHKRPNNNTKM